MHAYPNGAGYLFSWSDGSLGVTGGKFTPSKVEAYAEIHGYTAPSSGDHSAGDNSTHAYLSGMTWADVNHTSHTAVLSEDYNSTDHPAAYYQREAALPGANNIAVLDNRYPC